MGDISSRSNTKMFLEVKENLHATSTSVVYGMYGPAYYTMYEYYSASTIKVL